VAVRLGKRAIAPLIEKLQDRDRAVRGAAANALTQLGDTRAIQMIGGARKE
jgi:HEAT repeat protein